MPANTSVTQYPRTAKIAVAMLYGAVVLNLVLMLASNPQTLVTQLEVACHVIALATVAWVYFTRGLPINILALTALALIALPRIVRWIETGSVI